jgi:hypothetical protein
MRRPVLIALVILSAAGALACKPRPIPPNVVPPQADAPAQPAEPAKPDTPAPSPQQP